MLFKEFAGVDAFPICLDTKDPDEIVATVELIAPGFGGINLEDISAPRCFEIEEPAQGGARHPGLPRRPARHRGRRARRAAQRVQAARQADSSTCSVLVIGLGAAGVAVTKILLEAGVTPDHRLRLAGRAAHRARRLPRRLDDRRSSAGTRRRPTPRRAAAPRPTCIDGADLLIGLSGARVMPAEALQRMNDDAMVFAMANPNPEVSPEEARRYVRMMATGRSDYPNQINNVLCFPGIFRGALDVRARQITEAMKMAAAARRSPGSSPMPSCARTTSSRRSSTATSPPRSPRRLPPRRAHRAKRRPTATRWVSRRSTLTACTAGPESLTTNAATRAGRGGRREPRVYP